MGVLYALGMSENDAFGTFAGKRLFCALRYEIPNTDLHNKQDKEVAAP